MVQAREMKRDETAWILPNGERIPFENARQSLDGDFHWCRYINTPSEKVIKPSGKAPCFFAPEGGV